MAEVKTEVLIVGAGPAGLAAGLYGARDRYETIILDKFVPGGQINLTDRIENYPAIAQISGPEMVEAMQKQAERFGAQIKINSEVTGLKRGEGGLIEVRTDDDTYLAKVVILAPGSDYRHLGVKGEEEFRQAGAGVSYCGTCDAPFFKDKEVAAIGEAGQGRVSRRKISTWYLVGQAGAEGPIVETWLDQDGYTLRQRSEGLELLRSTKDNLKKLWPGKIRE